MSDSLCCIPGEMGTVVILVRVSIAVMKQHDQSSLGREGLIQLTLPHHCSSLKEDRAGTWRQELMQRPWRALLTGLLGLLSYRSQDHQPRDGHPQWAGLS